MSLESWMFAAFALLHAGLSSYLLRLNRQMLDHLKDFQKTSELVHRHNGELRTLLALKEAIDKTKEDKS